MAKHLTQAQRYYICRQIASGISKSNIAKELVVHISTIYRDRELERNSRDSDDYDSDYANKQANLRRHKASSEKAFKKLTPQMEKYIIEKPDKKWTPEQISGRMKIDVGKSISHQTIYKYIKHDKKNGGKLFKSLVHQGKKYRYGSSRSSNIVGRVGISERPKIVEKKILTLIQYLTKLYNKLKMI